MVRAGVGASFEYLTRPAATEAAELAMRRAGEGPVALAIVYTAPGHAPAYPTLLERVADVTGARHVVGCSAFGLQWPEGETEGDDALAVLVLGGEGVEVSTVDCATAAAAQRSACDALVDRAAAELDAPSLGLVLTTPVGFEAEPLLAAAAARLPGLPLLGGGATGSGRSTHVFHDGRIIEDGLVLALLGGVRAHVGVTQACRPLGPARRISEIQGNFISKIDGRPAVEVIRAAAELYLGRHDPEGDSADPSGLLAAVSDEPSREDLRPGAFAVRPILGVDPRSGAVALSAPARVGQGLALAVRDPATAVADMERMLDTATAALGRRPAAGLYIDCVGRGFSFYGRTDVDSRAIVSRAGEFPFLGFSSAFELGPLGARSEVLLYCGVLALLGDP